MDLKTKTVQIVMLSDLSPSGGGRETWIGQFVPQFLKLYDVDFKVCSVGVPRHDTVLQAGQSVSITPVWRWGRLLPWPVLFMVGYLYTTATQKRNMDVIVAVGGLAEACPVALANLIFRRKSRCVLWLRTVYIKEISNRIPCILRNVLSYIEKKLIESFCIVIANGEDTASFYRTYRPDIVVIENAVDIERWRASQKRYDGGLIHVSFIGRVTEIKGIREFVSAATILREASTTPAPFRFTVVGPCTENEKRELGFLDPNSSVEYLGPLPNSLIPDFLGTVDVCVNLTYGTGEFMGGGVSNAILEQMAAGKPQIVWDNPIYRNVADESFALFAREREVDSLVECIKQLWNIRRDIPAMSNSAMIRAKDFGWSRHISKAADAFFEE